MRAGSPGNPSVQEGPAGSEPDGPERAGGSVRRGPDADGGSAVRSPAAQAPERRRTWRGMPLRSVALVVISICLLSVAVVTSAVKANPGVWVIDEWTYIDYLHKVHDGDLYMEPGDLVGQEAMRDVSCRGLVQPGGVEWEGRPPCGLERYDPTTFLNAGVSTGSIHPPTYFVLTDLGARAVLLSGATDDLVTAGRLVGAGWMAAGLLALVLLMRELRVHPVAQGLAVVVVAVSPNLVESWQYLTPDAANVLVGSLVVLAAVRWARGRCPTWLLALAGLGAMLVKSPNLMVVCAAALIVLLLPGAEVRWPRRLLGVVAVGGSAVLATAALTVVGRLTARGDGGASPMDDVFAAEGFDPMWVVGNLQAFVGPLGRPSTQVFVLTSLVALALVGLLIGPALSPAVGAERDRVLLSRALVIMLFAGPVVVLLLVYVTQGAYVPVQSRYGHSLLPGVVAVAAMTWRSRGVQLVVGAALAVYAVASAATWSGPFPG
jgi:hypothetical protein